MERNCWWKISTALHALQSLFLARDYGKVAEPCYRQLQSSRRGCHKTESCWINRWLFTEDFVLF